MVRVLFSVRLLSLFPRVQSEVGQESRRFALGHQQEIPASVCGGSGWLSVNGQEIVWQIFEAI